jgi:hypothetical protein
MKISKETIEVLKNFSGINQNLVIKQGNKLSTIADAKNIMANVTVSETFDTEVGIYDLNEFLSALNLISDAEVEFGNNSVTIANSMASVNYRYSDPLILTSPQKEVKMPDPDFSVKITSNTISEIRKAGGALGHAVVSISSPEDTSKVYLEVKDPDNSSANTYRLDIGDDESRTYDFQFLISNLKLLTDDYEISVSSKLISQWKGINTNTQYWIALEKNSTFNS